MSIKSYFTKFYDDSESSGVLNARHRNFVRHEANQAANIKLGQKIHTHGIAEYTFFLSILKTRVSPIYKFESNCFGSKSHETRILMPSREWDASQNMQLHQNCITKWKETLKSVQKK